MARKILLIILSLSCCMWPSVRGQQGGIIRLWNNGYFSSSHTSGRVQVYLNSYWRNICRFSSFHSNEADVICHQLGYTGSSSWSYAANDTYGTFGSSYEISDVSCSTSQYLTLLQCTFATSFNSLCSNDDDVGVSCYTTRIWDNPYNGQIRLTGGSYSNEGLLEIYCNGRWGTVCDDLFGANEARAVCKQLGYQTYYRYDHLSISGSSSQPIWLDNVECSSSDTCLTSCQGCPLSEDHNCGHYEDITISCRSTTINSTDIANIVGSCPSSSPSLGGIIGGSIAGGVALIVIIIICIVYYYKKSSRRNRRTTGAVRCRPVVAPPPTLLPLSKTNQAAPLAYNANNIPPPPAYNPSMPQPTGYNPTIPPVAYPPNTQYTTQYGFGDPPTDGFTSQPPPAYDPNWAPPAAPQSIFQY